MEMHTRDSLRRVHGIEARPARTIRPAHLLSYTECLKLAGKERSKVFAKICSGAAKWVAALIGKSVINPIRRELHYRRDMETLQRMSDWELKDIGISRSEIGYSVRFGRADRKRWHGDVGR